MATYASLADAQAYVAGDLTITDSDLAERILLAAERDVDNLITPPVPTFAWDAVTQGLRDPLTGLRVDPDALTTWQAERLRDAVCAQFEYRLSMGEDFFLRPQPDSVSQPEGGGYQGRLQRVGPKVYDALDGSGLLPLTGELADPRALRDPFAWQRGVL